MIRRSRFGSPYPPGLMRQPESRVEIFDPTRGFHSGEPPQDLPPGMTPAARNFVVDGGYLTPRSGLSQFGAYSLGEAVLGGGEVFDSSGHPNAIVFSSGTVAYYERNAASWSALSYIEDASLGAPDTFSGETNSYAQHAAIYDPASDKNAVIFCNNLINYPKIAYLHDSLATYSDYTAPFSLLSKAKSVAAFDNRLLFFHTQDGSTAKPTRIVWSARGNPNSFNVIDGGGAEDLLDMRGSGQKVVAEKDSLLLFSDEEIWRARPRGDAYAFDFYPVAQQRGGPYPQTIVNTPFGTAFLGRDLEVYVVSGQDVLPLGPRRPGSPSRINRELRSTLTRPDRAWGLYNQEQHRYELYYTTSSATSGYPNRALFFHFENGAWMPQHYQHELTYGFEMEAGSLPLSWDEIEATWDQMNLTWDGDNSAGFGRNITTFGSAGTVYTFRSDQTTDDTTAIDCRWRSHALNSRDQLRFDQLYEVNIEAEVPSASSLSVMVSDDLGASFLDGFNINLSASSITNAFAPVWVTARAPQFEIRLNDGGTPKIARMQARLRDTGLYGGGA